MTTPNVDTSTTSPPPSVRLVTPPLDPPKAKHFGSPKITWLLATSAVAAVLMLWGERRNVEDRLARSEAVRVELVAQRAELEQQLAEAQARLAASEKSAGEARARVAQLEEQLRGAESLVAARTRELAASNEQIRRLRARLADAKGELGQVQAKIAEDSAEVTRLQREIQLGDRRLAEAAKVMAQVDPGLDERAQAGIDWLETQMARATANGDTRRVAGLCSAARSYKTQPALRLSRADTTRLDALITSCARP